MIVSNAVNNTYYKNWGSPDIEEFINELPEFVNSLCITFGSSFWEAENI